MGFASVTSLAPSSARAYGRDAARFGDWIRSKGVAPERANVSALLAYVDELRTEGCPRSSAYRACVAIVRWLREHGTKAGYWPARGLPQAVRDALRAF